MKRQRSKAQQMKTVLEAQIAEKRRLKEAAAEQQRQEEKKDQQRYQRQLAEIEASRGAAINTYLYLPMFLFLFGLSWFGWWLKAVGQVGGYVACIGNDIC